MSLIHNERTKLAANALDRASTACIAIGVFGPIAATLYSVSGTGGAGHAIVLAAGSLGWMIAAGALHLMARRVLGGLQ